MSLEELLARARGKVGRTVDQVGQFLGNPLPDWNWTERAEAAGAEPLTTQERINKSIENTGAIAEGDFKTALDSGVSLGNLGSRADGGILTNNQMTQNSGAVDNWLKQNGITSLDTLNPVQRDQYNQLVKDNGGGGGGGGGVDEAELARRARENRINSAKARAGQMRGEGQGIFDNILKAVGAFRERNTGLFNSAGQEITDNASEILGSNARTAQEASGDARARGRAFGLGDSSKFNLQNKVQGNLASTQGSTLATRGQQNRSNQNLYDERSDQAQDQENQANTYLKNVNEKAGVIERAGYDTADEVYDNALNDIVNYQRQLAAINPVQAGGLTQYTPDFSGVRNTISGVLNGVGGQGGGTQSEFGNPVNPTDVFSLLRKRGLVTA